MTVYRSLDEITLHTYPKASHDSNSDCALFATVKTRQFIIHRVDRAHQTRCALDVSVSI